MISVTEAAELMGLGRSQVLKLCNDGLLRAWRVGHAWVIDRESAKNYEPAPRGFAVVWERRRAKDQAGEQ